MTNIKIIIVFTFILNLPYVQLFILYDKLYSIKCTLNFTVRCVKNISAYFRSILKNRYKLLISNNNSNTLFYCVDSNFI